MNKQDLIEGGLGSQPKHPSRWVGALLGWAALGTGLGRLVEGSWSCASTLIGMFLIFVAAVIVAMVCMLDNPPW